MKPGKRPDRPENQGKRDRASREGNALGACNVAIVGMSCLYPDAPDLKSYWRNIVRGVDCVRAADEREWSSELYYDRQSKTFDKVYCKRGGFITDLADFDPLKFGIMPNGIHGGDPDQFLALKVASEALADAGYSRETFNGERAEVIIGRISAPGGGAMNMIQRGTTITQIIQILKQLHPEYSDDHLKSVAEALERSLLPCGPDTIPAVMPNVLAGRIAGKLNCRGRSLIVDAACASSLIALEIGVSDLRAGMCDVVLAGGIHVNSFALFYQMFCGLGALSREEKIRPFDDGADGTLLGEGVGIVVLKRLADAIKDQDRIYAVIKGIGSSSDGYGTSMLAPSDEGEALAMQRAYEMAGFSPRTVQLLEAHGTATAAGDVTEMQAIQRVFQADDQHRQWCALGSVKGNIGHTQAASGVAGLIKIALSLYQKVLPPTINVQTPNKQIDWQNSSCYINQRARLWVHPQVHAKVDRAKYPELAQDSSPRRAAVSAFGFGGVNAHAVLEEHLDAEESSSRSVLPAWDTEVCLFQAASKALLEEKLKAVHHFVAALATLASISEGERYTLKDVAFTLSEEYREFEESHGSAPGAGGKQADGSKRATGNKQARSVSDDQVPSSAASATSAASVNKLAIVASSLEDLDKKIEVVLGAIQENPGSPISELVIQNQDIVLAGNEKVKAGRLAFVLPGLGAAYPNMLADLSVHLPDVRAVFDFADHLALTSGASELPSEKIFPNPFRIAGKRESSAALLANEDSAVVMLLLAEWALYTVLTEIGIKPDALVGVSTGEFAVLNISGASDIIESAPLFYRFSTTVARSVPKDGLKDLRTIKIDGDWKDVEPLLQEIAPPVYLSAALSPKACLISGDKSSIAESQRRLKAAAIVEHMLPTAIPYHTPLVAGHIDADNAELTRLPIKAPKMEAWSCSFGEKYPDDAKKIRKITTNLFTRPIRLQETIERMYEAGITKFIEVGPKGTLVNVISEILSDAPHLVLASNRSTASAISQLNQMIAHLACHDVPMDLRYLFRRRLPQRLDFGTVPKRPARSLMRLSLVYPELRLPPDLAATLRQNLHHERSAAENKASMLGNRAAIGIGNEFVAGGEVTTGNALVQDNGTTQHNGTTDGIGTTMANGAAANSSTAMGSGSGGGEEAPTGIDYFNQNLLAMQAQFLNSMNGLSFDMAAAQAAVDPSGFGAQLPVGHDIFTPARQHPPFVPHQKCSLLNAGLISFTLDEHQFEANLCLNIFEHQYLQSHAIGGSVSRSFGDERVFLLPLTAALELMAEAASCLAPGLVPVRLENIRALKRIRAGFAGTVINVMARRKKGSMGRFEACIRLVQDPQLPESLDSAAMSCDLVFAVQAPRANRSLAIAELVPDGRAPHLTPEQLYTPATMFHGPLMQCVSSLVRLNKKQILARVNAKDAFGWLPSSPNPEFMLNPLLLDNVTQPVLFHLYEQGQAAHALLPFFVDSLEIFSDLNVLRGEFYVHATLNSITNRGTEADVTLIAADGTPLAQFNNICSRRIVVGEPWRSHIYNPDQTAFGASHQPELSPSIPDSTLWTSCCFDSSILPDEDVALTWLLDYLLNPQEQRYAEQAITNGARRREWVLGRIAAKEAVRKLLLQFHGLAIPLADIIIGRYESGKPWVCGEFVNYIGWAPSVSISHKGGKAFALAAHPQAGASVGIDMEIVEQREEGFERLAFTDYERETIARVPLSLKPLAMSAIWCAKEAAAKALGTGMQNNPKSVQISALTQPDGSLMLGVPWQAEVTCAAIANSAILPVTVFGGRCEVLAMSYVPAAVLQPVSTP